MSAPRRGPYGPVCATWDPSCSSTATMVVSSAGLLPTPAASHTLGVDITKYVVPFLPATKEVTPAGISEPSGNGMLPPCGLAVQVTPAASGLPSAFPLFST